MKEYLPKIRQKLNLYRRYRYWSKEDCIFIHVPKAAGTSINRALYGRTLGHYTALEIRTAFPSLFNRAKKFSFVRNPWDRAYSAFKFASIGRTNAMGVFNPDQYKIESFSTFERFVLEWLPAHDLSKADFIFRPQSGFLCDAQGDLMMDYVGQIENMNDGLAKVEELLGRKLLLGHENSTSAGMPSYRDAYLNNEMIDAVHELYSGDVSRFGYQYE